MGEWVMGRFDYWCAICSCWSNHPTDGHDVFEVMAGEMTATEAATLAPTQPGAPRTETANERKTDHGDK